MIVEIKIPSPGESITEVVIAEWLVEDGAQVEKNQEVAEVESDKATLPLITNVSGKITILSAAGETVNVGSVACTVNSDEVGSEQQSSELEAQPVKEEKSVKPAEKSAPAPAQKNTAYEQVKITPVAKKIMDENQLSVDDVINGLRRLSKQDIEAVLSAPLPAQQAAVTVKKEATRDSSREKMSSLRRKISERLVSVKNETAMLTTFNEIDMSAVMSLRQEFQKQFVEKNGVKVGFMSFFMKATAIALKHYPHINAMIDGEDIVFHSYADIGIAVQSAKGLLVPVIRNIEAKSLAEIELAIKDFGARAQANRIKLEELSGGTFTITNGGTFGSLLSTPIINPPQSGILGMHNIVDRPVAINGKVEIRPMMYVALSYDHRLIDGKSSVGFLKMVKELIENPSKMLFDGAAPESILLDL